MTGSANCDIVSKGRGDFCGAKLIGEFSYIMGEEKEVMVYF